MFRFLKNSISFIVELIVVLLIGYFLFYAVIGYKQLKQSQEDPVFQQVLSDINHNETAIDILGAPIKPELLFFDHKTNHADRRETKQVDLVIPIYGTKKTATLFARLVQTGNDLHYTALFLNVDGYQKDIDLLLLGGKQ
jgi:hypothetical protein